MIKPTNSNDDLGPRGFKLIRAGDANGSYDPCAGIEWRPPRESDELFEALRKAFPGRKTHRERIQEALVEFLAGELDRNGKPEVHVARTAEDKEVEIGRRKVANESLRMSKKPLFRTQVSQRPQDGGTQQSPEAPKEVEKSKEVDAIQPSSKAKDWDDMTVVWKSNVGLTKGARPRRMMTEEERTDYRMRRVRGACVSCKRKKRKCSHDPDPSPSTSLESIHTPEASTDSEENKDLLIPKSPLTQKVRFKAAQEIPTQELDVAMLPKVSRSAQPMRSALRSDSASRNARDLGSSPNSGLSTNGSVDLTSTTKLPQYVDQMSSESSAWNMAALPAATAFEDVPSQVWWNTLENDHLMGNLAFYSQDAMLQPADFASSFGAQNIGNSPSNIWLLDQNLLATTESQDWMDLPDQASPNWTPSHHPQSKISPASLLSHQPSPPNNLFVSLEQIATSNQYTQQPPPFLDIEPRRLQAEKESEVLNWLHQKIIDEQSAPRDPELEVGDTEQVPPSPRQKKPRVKFDFSSLIDGPPTLSSGDSPPAGLDAAMPPPPLQCYNTEFPRLPRSLSRHSMSSRGDVLDVMSLSSALTTLSMKDGGWSRRTSVHSETERKWHDDHGYPWDDEEACEEIKGKTEEKEKEDEDDEDEDELPTSLAPKNLLAKRR